MRDPLIFEKSRAGRWAFAQGPAEVAEGNIPAAFLRDEAARLPEVSELQVVRHFTRPIERHGRSADRTGSRSAASGGPFSLGR